MKFHTICKGIVIIRDNEWYCTNCKKRIPEQEVY